MERKFLQDNWSDMRGQVGEWWDELTDDDLDMVNGNQDELVRVLQERYGYTEDLARAEVEERFAKYNPENTHMENRSRGSVGTGSESSPKGRGQNPK